MGNRIEEHIREMFGGNQVGVSPDATMKNTRGLDAIDLEAEQQGQADRRLRSMTPKKRHIFCRIK